MRRNIIGWIALALVLPAVWLLLTSLPSGGSGANEYRLALGESLSILGVTLTFLTRGPKPSQVNAAVIVSMVLSIVLFRPVVMRARGPNGWRLVAHVTWGTPLLLSLASVAAALFGDSGDALFLASVACGLTLLASLFMMMARLPADSRQQ